MAANKKVVTEDPEEKIVEIQMERLRPFRNHPYKVEADYQMAELMESIKKFGIINPLVVRPMLDGYYEIISGHRRKYAAEKLGYRKVPVIIRVLQDDDAITQMVDANIYREVILPSEKAKAYKMKYEAMKRKSGRKRSDPVDHQWKGKKTLQILAEEYEDSPKQIQRYLKITELIPEMMQMLDKGLIALNPAVEIAFLSDAQQKMMLEAMDFTQVAPSLSQAQRIKKLCQENQMDLATMKEILGEVKMGEQSRVIFTNEQLYKYFPRTYAPSRMKREILEILQSWLEQNWNK